MIPAVHTRGTNVGGLLRYLFGPGKREEHADPHLIAAWAGANDLATLEPPTTADGRRDVRRLVELLEQPVAVGWKPPSKPVWHCSIRTHPADRVLTDAQWAHIAAEVMAAVGLAPHGDLQAVRWVAVRHSADHIHLVATRVRQDRRTAWTSYDYRKAQTACRDLEERYGLYRVAPPGSGSRRWPHPVELNKAARLGATAGRTAATGAGRTIAPREELRRRVRAVAAVATDEADFLARLHQAGVLVKLRYSTRPPGEVTGYAVALARHTTAAGQTIWYGGGRLATDLTLPQLRARFIGTPPTRPGRSTAAQLANMSFPPPDVYRRAVELTGQAAAAMRNAASPAVASAIAYAAADVLTAIARAWEGHTGGPLTDAAELFDRAAYQRHSRTREHRTPAAVHLRSMARLIAMIGAISRDADTAAALHLIYTLAALAENLANLRDAQHRRHQAQAARTVAVRLRTWTPPGRDPNAPSEATRPVRHQTGRRTPAEPSRPTPHSRHR